MEVKISPVILQELIPRLTFVSRRANLSSSVVVKSNEKQALKKIMVPKFASVVARVQGLMGQSEEQASTECCRLALCCTCLYGDDLIHFVCMFIAFRHGNPSCKMGHKESMA